MSVVVALLAVVVGLLAVVVVGLLRTNAEVLRALERLGVDVDGDDGPTLGAGLDRAGLDRAGLDRSSAAGGLDGAATGRRVGGQPAAQARTGRPAPDLVGATLDRGQQVLRVAGTRHDTLLLFLSSGCLTCRSFWDALREQPGLGLPSRVRVVAVAKDLAEESPSSLAELVPTAGASTLLSTQAWADYEVPGSPYVVLVEGASGRVAGEGTGATWDQVGGMLAQATGDLVYAGGRADRTPKAGRDMAAERDTDVELLRAGIRPGDPSLYPDRAHPDRDAEGGGHPGDTPDGSDDPAAG